MAKDTVVIGITAKNETKKGIDSAEKSFKGLGATVTKLVGAGLGIAAVKSFGEAMFSAAIESQKLNASLIAVTGSQEKAAKAMKQLRDFAATTPFQLTQVTDAFIKMKALGLDASEEALRSYGNTASAMGKDLNQLIEAVADASTGEFERLKEFGIKSKSEGDKVSFTFQGVTTTVKKNAEEITGFLQTIGETTFGTAMEEQMKTLGGAVSNFGDAWNTLLVTLSETGAADTATEVILGLAAAFKDLSDAIGPDTKSDELQGLFDKLAALQESSRKNDEILEKNRSKFIVDQKLIERGEGRQNSLLRQRLEIREQIKALQTEIAIEEAPEVEEEKKKESVKKSPEQAAEEAQKIANAELDILIQQLETEAALREGQDAVREEQNARIVADYEARVQAEIQIEKLKQATIEGILSNVSSLMGSESRKLFEIGKVASIANATIKTIEAAQNAYTWGTAFGGPVAGGIAAAAAAAAGAVNIQKIQSTQFGGGGGTPQVSSATGPGGAVGPVTQPQPIIPTLPAFGDNIEIASGSFIAQYVETELIPAMNEADKRGVKLVIT